MNIPLHHGHWLNRGMNIKIAKIDEDCSLSVAITGIEFVENGKGGRRPEVHYAICLVYGPKDTNVFSRPVDTVVVENALDKNEDVLEKALEWLKTKDGVSERFQGLAAEYDRLLAYGLGPIPKRDKTKSL